MICSDVGQGGQDKCLFEARTAFDCLARLKVRKHGDLTDNQGACKHHIKNMKEALGSQHEGYLQSQIETLTYGRQSFV